MPPTTVVVALALVGLILVILVLRGRGKTEEEPKRFEPPKEIAKRPPKEKPAEAAPSKAPPASEKTEQKPAVGETAPARTKSDLPPTFPTAPPPAADAMPPSTEEIAAENILTAEKAPAKAPAKAEEKKTPRASIPPPLPKGRAPLRSYSSINDEAVAEEIRAASVIPAPPKEDSSPTGAEPKPGPKPLSEPKLEAKAKPAAPKAPVKPTSEPKVEAKPKLVSEPKLGAAAKPISEPKVTKAEEHDFSALNEPRAAKAAAPAPAPAARFVPPSNPATAELEKSDPRHAAARRLARVSVSEIKLYHEDEVKAGREAKDLYKRLGQDIALAKQTFEARVADEVRSRFDYLYDEILRQLAEGDVTKLGPDAPPPPPNNGPPSDAGLHDAPTRTQLKTVEDAPPAKPAEAAMPESARTPISVRSVPTNPATAELEKNDPRHAAARRLARLSVSEIKLYHEDEIKAGREAKDLWTRMRGDIALAVQTFEKRVDKEVRERFDYLYDEILRQLAEGDVEKLGADAPKPKAAAAPEPAKPAEAAPPPPAAAAAAAAPTTPAPAPAAAAPAGPGAAIAARYAPASNPATAELEKTDPRHAAARRLARLSVSEIKLYHEDEVKAGREAKDLWKRLMADIGLATQTYEKRVDKEVRERFNYLYDEILRQLAEGDASKLGPEAPATPKMNA